MKKCLKIHVIGNVQTNVYKNAAQKKAQALDIEGTLQNTNGSEVIIFARGNADDLDEFIDFLYQGTSTSNVEDIEAEPYMQEKDFRGVFRIIGS